MKKNLLITATLVLSLFTSCAHKMGDAIAITVVGLAKGRLATFRW